MFKFMEGIFNRSYSGIQPVSREVATEFLSSLCKGWVLNDDATELRREFQFKHFMKTMGFANAVAWVASYANHHPHMELGPDHCVVRFRTPAIDGLSVYDFICAAMVNALFENPEPLDLSAAPAGAVPGHRPGSRPESVISFGPRPTRRGRRRLLD